MQILQRDKMAMLLAVYSYFRDKVVSYDNEAAVKLLSDGLWTGYVVIATIAVMYISKR